MPKASGKLNLDDEQFNAILNKAIEHHNKGEAPEAESLYRTLILSRPNHADPHHLLGILACQTQNYHEAEEQLLKAISIDHLNPNYHLSIGTIFFNQRKLSPAFEAYQKCLSLAPNELEASIGVANIYDLQGAYQVAVTILSDALVKEPDSYRLLNNLGNLYRKTLNYEQASKCLKKAALLVNIPDDSHEVFKNIALLYLEMGQIKSAIQWHEQALKIKPDAELLANLYFEYQTICQWHNANEIEEFLDKYINYNIVANKTPGERPLLNIIRCQNMQRNLTITTAWSQMLANNLSGVNALFNFEDKRFTGKKIRVGYISNHFRDHPSAHLMLRLFEYHNPDNFETFVYSYGPNDQSSYRNKIKQDCDHFIDIQDKTFEESAKTIYNDNIQILVDISGYTLQAKPEIVALKPAPIIVNYLGFPGTSGSPTYDYIISDPIVMPQSSYQYFTETAVIMPGCYQINDHQPEISKLEVKRSDYHLPEDKLILCSFNQMHKITQKLFSQWVNILKKCPNTVLWLYTPIQEAKDNILRFIESESLSKSRVIFADRVPKNEHLARLPLADLALDTLGYNGHTTTTDALFSGVPVISMMGTHFASRVSASLLTTFGLPELIARNESEYYHLILEHSQNANKLQDLKNKVLHCKQSTSLYDTRKFVSHLEQAYQAMWKNYQAKQKDTIIIDD